MKVFEMKSKKMKVWSFSFGVLFVLLAGGFALYSCEEIVTVEVPVNDFVIDLEDLLVVENAMHKSGDDELNLFSETRTIHLSDWESLAKTVTQYRSKIKSVKVKTASIIITSSDGGTVVKDFLLQMDDVDLRIPQYDLGTVYSDGLHDLGKQLLTNLFLNESVALAVSGKTDVESGKNLTVKIRMQGIVLITNPLK